MRVLLDTNILARAAVPGEGPARAALLQCTKDPHILLISAFIISELSRILRYERVRKVHGLDEIGIDRYIAELELAAVAVLLPEMPQQRVVTHHHRIPRLGAARASPRAIASRALFLSVGSFVGHALIHFTIRLIS